MSLIKITAYIPHTDDEIKGKFLINLLVLKDRLEEIRGHIQTEHGCKVDLVYHEQEFDWEEVNK